ncbi:MAG: hypothetical protein ACRYG7_16045 [Janthinobacterium lividum]
MKVVYYTVFALLLAATLPGWAQLLPPPSATDTTSRTNEGGLVQYRMGSITQVDGTTITGYMPCNLAGYGGGKLIYFLPPLSIDAQLRHRHTIKIPKIKQMAVHGRLYETVQQRGKNTDILALHLFEGPISLAMYTEPRAIALPLPIPMGAFTAVPLLRIKISDKDHWYLSRNGVCTKMPRAHFADLMSAYLFDNPDLAGKVARQEPHYLHANTPTIIAEYNRAKL